MTYQELPELLTIQQAAKLINVHPNTLRNWEKEGKIAVVRIGSRRDRRFPKSAIWQLSQPTSNDNTTYGVGSDFGMNSLQGRLTGAMNY